MSSLSQFAVRRSRPTACLLVGLTVFIAGGCGLPTWSELIGAKKEENAPVVVPVQPVPQNLPVTKTPPPPAPPSPAEVIAEFQSRKSYELNDDALNKLLSLESGLEDVKVLNLNGSQVTNLGMARLGKLSHLTKLDIRNSPVNETAAAAIAQATSIEELSVDGTEFTDQGLAALRPLQNLRVLEINQVRLTPQGWAEMFAHPELEELRIVQSNVNDDGLLALSKCPKLRRIQMNDVAITDLGLAQLGRLDVLEYLNISGCNVTGQGFRGTGSGRGSFLALQDLSMQKCPLNEKGAAVISAMKQLKALNISSMPSMQDMHFIKMIKPLKELQYLHLVDNTGLTGQALTALAGHDSIETIILNGCTSIDDRGLAQLVKCKNLKRLELADTRCSPRGAAALMAEIPGLEIGGVATGASSQ